MYQKSNGGAFNRGFGVGVLDEEPPLVAPIRPKPTYLRGTVLHCEVHGVIGDGLRRRTPFGGVVMTCPVCDDRMLWSGADTLCQVGLTEAELAIARRRIGG